MKGVKGRRLFGELISEKEEGTTHVVLRMADRLSENDGVVEFLGSSHSEGESDGGAVSTRFGRTKHNGTTSSTEKV